MRMSEFGYPISYARLFTNKRDLTSIRFYGDTDTKPSPMLLFPYSRAGLARMRQSFGIEPNEDDIVWTPEISQEGIEYIIRAGRIVESKYDSRYFYGVGRGER